MDTPALFKVALGLTPPWDVSAVRFSATASGGRGQLDLELDFPRGSRFPCSRCGTTCPVHDTSEKQWRHLDFFQHLTFLKARVPRTNCSKDGVHQVAVPWAREGSGFTLLFEAFVMLMAPEVPMAALARTVGVHDTRLWRVVQAHVAKAREAVDMSEVTALVVDETSRARGQAYVTLFAEPGRVRSRVLYVAEGHDASTFHRFLEDFKAHGGDPVLVRDIAMDMSAGFQKGAAEKLPWAEITFDRFHVMKLVNEGVDEIRREETKGHPELRGTRFAWLRNRRDLRTDEKARIDSLSSLGLRTALAYQMRLVLQTLWCMEDLPRAQTYLKTWLGWAFKDTRSRAMGPMRKVARTIRDHSRGILNYFRGRMTTAVLEGINSLAQAARARARGYRNPRTFTTLIYLIAGRLRFDLPSLTHTI